MRAIRTLLVSFLLGASTCLSAAAATTTTLTVTVGGSPATTIASGTVVQLTAQVNGGTITSGLVNFCDATATYCTDIHILGSAQLTSAGTAVFRLVPGIGSHSYKAVFVGTNANAASTSSVSSLTVTGPYATASTLTDLGEQGNYSLTATVVGAGSAIALTGSLSFVDTTAGTTLATMPVGSSTQSADFIVDPIPASTKVYQAITAADFNGDGKPDLAILDTDGTIAILLGKGDGTFTTGTGVTAGNVPGAMVAADLNSDGYIDLVTVNSDGTLSVILGHGDGTFATATSVPFAGSFYIAVGDFNGDGKPDLVGSSAGSLIVLLGNGDGTFATSTKSISAGSGFIAVGDFNGDGKTDVAVAGAPPVSESEPQNGVVNVLLGNGDGTFADSVFSTTTVGVPTAMAVADFNLDGNADMVIESFGLPADLDPMGQLSAGVLMLLGSGNGTFSVVSSALPAAASSIAVADFNQDGKPDLALAAVFGYDEFQPEAGAPGPVQLGNGDGTFTAGPAATSVDSGGSDTDYQLLSVADFNGDGFPDLGELAGFTENFAETQLYQSTQTATVTIPGVSLAGTGTHLVDVTYPGDGNYLPSVSTTVPLIAGAPTIVISPLTLSSATVTLAYRATITAQGGKAPYTFTSVNLPIYLGLTLSNAGVLSGIPLASGVYTFTVTATDSTTGTPNSTSIMYSVVVEPLVIGVSTLSLPDGVVGVSYSQPLSAFGGTPPYMFTAIGLPAGLTISSTGEISGTPTAAGTSTVSISIQDSTPNAPLFGGTTFTLTIDPGGFNFAAVGSSSSTVTAGASGKYTLTLTPLGTFTSQVSFSCGDNMPDGASCSFTPASVTPGSVPVNTVLTITTTAPSRSQNSPPLSPLIHPSGPGDFGSPLGRTTFGGMSLAAVLLIYIPRRFRDWRVRPRGQMLSLLGGIIAAGLLSGCGGGGIPAPIIHPGTPAGTYAINVTATQASTTTPITQTTTVTLIVQ